MLKPGDKVKICKTNYTFAPGWVPEMDAFVDKIVTLYSKGTWWRIVEDKRIWSWNEKWFEVQAPFESPTGQYLLFTPEELQFKIE